MTKLSNRISRNDLIIDDALTAHGRVCTCGCRQSLNRGQYHWHHLNTATKIETISDLRRATRTKLLAELAKCLPMKADCHLKGQHGH